MKKGLSLLLAASVAFSAFSATAFAATPQTAEEKYEALVEAGIFEGFPDGEAHLEDPMTRAQAAKIVALVLGLDLNEDAASVYTDLADAKWAAGFIGAATEAGILNGRGNGIFDPSANVSVQELAKIMVEALDIEVDATATVEGADEWAQAYVAAAVAAKLIPAQDDYTAPASRTILVEASYSAYTTAQEPEKVEFGAKAVGAKKIEVSFGAAVDTSKVTLAIKKGNTPINAAKTTFAEDKKSVVIETSTKLTKGDYTVTASGVSAEALTATISVEDEKVAKIEFQSDKAALVRGNAKQVEIYYTITNQYGETINAAESQTTFTYTKGNPGATGTNGKLVLTSASDFTLNESITVYALHNSGTFAQQTFSVAPVAQVAKVEIKGLYNKDGKTPTQGDAPASYGIEVVAKDQYGRNISESLIDNDTIVTVTNPSVFNVATGENAFVKDGDRVLLPLAAPTADPVVTTLTNAGKGTVLIMSKTTGEKATIEVEVKEAVKVAELTLSAPEIVVAGETVEIPYTAVDQNGNALGKAKDFAKLNAIALTSSAGTLTWKVDYVADKVTLELNVNGAGMSTITTATPSFISGTANNKIVQLQISVNPVKKALVVTGLKDVATAIAKDGSLKIKHENIQIVDQYSRVKTLKDFAGYHVNITTSDAGKVSVANDVYQTGTTETVVNGVAAGSSTLTFKLGRGAEAIDGSEFAATFRTVTVADIASYDVSVVDTVYAGGADYKKELKVEGKLADGSKVAVPVGNNAYYEVNETTTGLEYVTVDGKGYFQATAATDVEAGKEKAYGFAVIGKVKDGQSQVVTNEVKVSKVVPTITTLVLTDNGTRIRKVSDGYAKITLAAAESADTWVSLAEELIDAKDQYGVAVAGNVVATAVPAGIPAVRADFKEQDTFTIVVGTTNGKYETIKVIVVDAF